MIRMKNIVHPSEILLEEFLKPTKISQNKLALVIHVPVQRIYTITKGTHGITADIALRLGKYLGTGPEFWTKLQSNYDLCIAASKMQKELDVIPQVAFA